MQLFVLQAGILLVLSDINMAIKTSAFGVERVTRQTHPGKTHILMYHQNSSKEFTQMKNYQICTH